MVTASDRARVVVAICTYRRNADLEVLLRALGDCAARVRDHAAVGVAIVDDTASGDARPVADAFADSFELGLRYGISGRQNISLARNMVIETALGFGDWIAMTDDDCEPPAEWLEELLRVQAMTGADAVTGRMVRRAPPGSPQWLTDEPFFDLGVEVAQDGAEVPAGATFNSLISADWLRLHPDIRFDPEFGVIGGEDMMFYRAARAAGLDIRFAARAFVYENESPARATLGYQLYVHYWHGNSACHSSVGSGMPRWRMAVHGGASLARAVAYPIKRIASGKTPQFRYGMALMLHAAGKLVGVAGVRVDHR